MLAYCLITSPYCLPHCFFSIDQTSQCSPQQKLVNVLVDCLTSLCNPRAQAKRLNLRKKKWRNQLSEMHTEMAKFHRDTADGE